MVKKYIQLAFISVICCTTLTAVAAESLCSPREKIFFSCRIGKKIVSVCASTDYPAATSSFQYRFGPKGTPEMAWPEPATSRAGVTFGNIAYSDGGLGYIRFAKGDTGYVVYSGMVPGLVKEGVLVERNGKRTADYRCKGLADEDLWHTGLPEDNQDLENATNIEIP